AFRSYCTVVMPEGASRLFSEWVLLSADRALPANANGSATANAMEVTRILRMSPPVAVIHDGPRSADREQTSKRLTSLPGWSTTNSTSGTCGCQAEPRGSGACPSQCTIKSRANGHRSGADPVRNGRADARSHLDAQGDSPIGVMVGRSTDAD